jgi:hypothetical protein
MSEIKEEVMVLNERIMRWLEKPIQYDKTSIFGANRGSHLHAGVDFEPNSDYMPEGQFVTPYASGRVVQVGKSNSYGNFVVVEHRNEDGNYNYSNYAHLQDDNPSLGPLVKPGDYVSHQSIVGVMGNTGGKYRDGTEKQLSPHLHWEIYRNKDPNSNGQLEFHKTLRTDGRSFENASEIKRDQDGNPVSKYWDNPYDHDPNRVVLPFDNYWSKYQREQTAYPFEQDQGSAWAYPPATGNESAEPETGYGKFPPPAWATKPLGSGWDPNRSPWGQPASGQDIAQAGTTGDAGWEAPGPDPAGAGGGSAREAAAAGDTPDGLAPDSSQTADAQPSDGSGARWFLNLFRTALSTLSLPEVAQLIQLAQGKGAGRSGGKATAGPVRMASARGRARYDSGDDAYEPGWKSAVTASAFRDWPQDELVDVSGPRGSAIPDGVAAILRSLGSGGRLQDDGQDPGGVSGQPLFPGATAPWIKPKLPTWDQGRWPGRTKPAYPPTYPEVGLDPGFDRDDPDESNDDGFWRHVPDESNDREHWPYNPELFDDPVPGRRGPRRGGVGGIKPGWRLSEGLGSDGGSEKASGGFAAPAGNFGATGNRFYFSYKQPSAVQFPVETKWGDVSRGDYPDSPRAWDNLFRRSDNEGVRLRNAVTSIEAPRYADAFADWAEQTRPRPLFQDRFDSSDDNSL